MRLHIKPTNGRGWFDPTGKPMGMPPPFDFDAEVSSEEPFIAFGTFKNAGHPLSGLWIRLAKQHFLGSEYCDLAAFNIPPVAGEPMDPETDIIAGCAFVEIAS
jgi:hypothetical protein